MPIYVFKCTNEKCENFNKEIEELLSVADYENKKFPVCEICGLALKQTYKAGQSFKFNGTGFYSTDYKNKWEVTNMKHNIRHAFFETNSSSIHAICIPKKSNISIDFDKILVSLGDYGWEYRTYDRIPDKLSYLVTALFQNKDYQRIYKVFKTLEDYGIQLEFLDNWLKTIYKNKGLVELNDVEPYTYIDIYGVKRDYGIDHADEAYNIACKIVDDSNLLTSYLFGQSLIITGNDNDDSYETIKELNDIEDYVILIKGN